MKKNARDAATTSKKDAHDVATTEVDFVPVEKSIVEIINDKLKQQIGNLQNEIKQLRSDLTGKVSAPA